MVFPPNRYHCGFSFQGKPVGTAGTSRRWPSSLRRVGAATVAALAVAFASGPVDARGPTTAQGERAVIAFAELPPQAQETHRLIRQGGPFPYEKDGTVFFNRERLLPVKPRGYYREYTCLLYTSPSPRDD